MTNLRWFVWLFWVVLTLACGTLEVGIERATTPTRALATSEPSPTARPSSSATTALTAAPISAPTATLVPSATRERITFEPGSTVYTFTVTLTRGVPKPYVLTILAQQQMTVTASGDVTIVVLDPQNKAVVPASARQGQWVGAMPQTGDYTIVLQGDGAFSVSISIPPLGG